MKKERVVRVGDKVLWKDYGIDAVWEEVIVTSFQKGKSGDFYGNELDLSLLTDGETVIGIKPCKARNYDSWDYDSKFKPIPGNEYHERTEEKPDWLVWQEMFEKKMKKIPLPKGWHWSYILDETEQMKFRPKLKHPFSLCAVRRVEKVKPDSEGCPFYDEIYRQSDTLEEGMKAIVDGINKGEYKSRHISFPEDF